MMQNLSQLVPRVEVKLAQDRAIFMDMNGNKE
jgi:hypothetical protein